MILKEKFKEILTAFWINDWEDKCEKIADEFAIGFVEWCDNEGYTQINNLSLWKSLNDDKGKYSKELLEIYKKEKVL